MWIARDEDGTLCIFENKPERTEEEIFFNQKGKIFTVESEDEFYVEIDKRLFPDITYENSPKEIILK